MEEHIQQAGHQWMRQALKETVRQWEQGHRGCPTCGSQAVRTEGTVRRSILTLFGVVELPRRRYRCQACHQRFCPSKGLLASLHVRRVTTPLKEAALQAGASWPYRQAVAWLKQLTGAQISAEEMRLLTNEAGQVCAQRQAQEASTPPMPAPSCEPGSTQQRCIIGLDGGWVCSREKRGGMEGKIAVIATGQEWGKQPQRPSGDMTWIELERYIQTHRHPPRQRSRFSTRRYVATFEPSRALGRQAGAALHHLGLQQHPQVVVADGAQWIKQETQKHFPHALRILDWPHLWRTIRQAANVVGRLTERDEKAHAQQVQQVKTWLWNGEVERAQALLKQWQHELADLPAHRKKVLSQAITYLEKQRDWIGSYEQWKQEGYPVGSGIIERGVALVINRRMKRRGMRWLRKNATAVVALRVDLLNADWHRPLSSRSFP
jgi:hypothetical protein